MNWKAFFGHYKLNETKSEFSLFKPKHNKKWMNLIGLVWSHKKKPYSEEEKQIRIGDKWVCLEIRITQFF